MIEPKPAYATTIPHDYSKRAMVFGGRSSQDLAAKIAGKLQLGLGDVTLKTFADGRSTAASRSRSVVPTSSWSSPPAPTTRPA